MGYRVKIFPLHGRSGYMEYGRVAQAYRKGTYYPHPSSANVAAQRWAKNHPGGRAQVEIYSTGEVIGEFFG